jgi:hypothetical protein
MPKIPQSFTEPAITSQEIWQEADERLGHSPHYSPICA